MQTEVGKQFWEKYAGTYCIAEGGSGKREECKEVSEWREGCLVGTTAVHHCTTEERWMVLGARRGCKKL